MPCRISEKNGLEMSGTVTSSLPRAQRAQVLRGRVRRVAEPLDGGHHLAPRVGRDDVGLAEHARDGRGRDAGAFGDFVDVGHGHLSLAAAMS